MNQKMNTGWGLIGASTIARQYIADAIRAQHGHFVQAVMSSNQERAEKFAKDCNIPAAYSTLEAILADPLVKVVYISTTNELHFEQAIAAAAAGNNADWARRKRNTTELQQKSSYSIGLSLEAGQTLESISGLPFRDYAYHGGSFPIRVRGSGVVGSVTISGLPQRDDHNVVAQVMAELIGEDLQKAGLELSPQ